MKYYAVRVGLKAPLITTSWQECSESVTGYSGAIFKSFKTEKEAIDFIGITANNTTATVTTTATAMTINTATNTTITIKSNINDPTVKKVNLFSDILVGTEDTLKIENIITNFIISNNNKICTLIAYTDGSCLNQGLSDRSKWYSGSGIFLPDLDLKIGLKCDDKGIQTNNRAELYPIVWILNTFYNSIQLLAFDSKNSNDIKIIIYSDSNYAITNLNSNNIRNTDLWKNLKFILSKLKTELNVNVQLLKVLAHSGVHGNEMADTIANYMASL